MKETIIDLITGRSTYNKKQVEAVLDLFDQGATIPFIARYRKEATGSLDEVQIADIKDQYDRFGIVISRKEYILKTIEAQEKLTGELKQKIESTWSLTELEDLFMPYKPKRKTRALMAVEKGLEPLAKIVMAQNETDPEKRAGEYLNEKVATAEEALQGARDIIAEWINENMTARKRVRQLYAREAMVSSRLVREDEGAEKFKDYFQYEEALKKVPSHRMLALFRGEKEGFLRVSITPSRDKAIELLERIFLKGNNNSSKQVSVAIQDSYKRLLSPSLENEFRNLAKENADEEAIRVFAENLRQLLLAPPLGQKRTLAIDPGYRTGCKVVVLDEQGNLLHNQTIYPHKPQEEKSMAMKKLSTLVESYKVEAIAIGNGTASRETEYLVKNTRFNRDIQVFVVSENGASVYSASPVAREEFPDYDVTVRGAVSIGRRLMDPLAELVKIDPKSIGVGQYQHDVDQQKLKQSLDQVVEICVNKVGVNLNTASKHLLTYVSGLGPSLAQQIVDYRLDNGAFLSRKALKNVPRLGEKAFEQSAGFLRIPGSENPLDNTAVHPESYHIVGRMAKDLQASVEELIKNKELRKQIDLNRYVTENTGLPTLIDIMEELEKPGRDPRDQIEMFEFAKGIHKPEDLKEGMVLPGIVTNITNFGAFVDVGVKQDGLVHVSQIADKFVKNPADVVQLHQKVTVKVLEVDIKRKRIQLTMKISSN